MGPTKVKNQFVKFLLSGGIAAAVNLASRYVIDLFISFEVAVVVAYLIGMTTAYFLARAFVFESSGRSFSSEFHRFALVNLFALIFVWGISVGLVRIVFPAMSYSWHADDIAHLIGVLAPAVTSYFGHRFYTFSKQ